MNLLVIGAPGTGKTSLVEYAHSCGYKNFFDTDAVPGLCEWRNGPVEDVTPTGDESWYATNGWYWKPKKVSELLNSAENPVICGSADNVFGFYGLFDKIVLLYKSREDIVHNLLAPGREQPNGKNPAHHDRILRWQGRLFESLKPFDATITGNNSVEVMFGKILQALSD